MTNITTSKGEFIFVEVPEDAENFTLHDNESITFDSKIEEDLTKEYWGYRSINKDSYEKIISTTKDITEEQAQLICPFIESQYVYQNFMGLLDQAWDCGTAIQSLQSLIKANNLDINNNYLIIKKM